MSRRADASSSGTLQIGTHRDCHCNECSVGWGGGAWGDCPTANIPLISSVGQVTLCGLIVVHNADVGALCNHVHIAEVHAVSDVGEEEEVGICTLVQDAKPAARSPVWDAGECMCSRHLQ